MWKASCVSLLFVVCVCVCVYIYIYIYIYACTFKLHTHTPDAGWGNGACSSVVQTLICHCHSIASTHPPLPGIVSRSAGGQGGLCGAGGGEESRCWCVEWRNKTSCCCRSRSWSRSSERHARGKGAWGAKGTWVGQGREPTWVGQGEPTWVGQREPWSRGPASPGSGGGGEDRKSVV